MDQTGNFQRGIAIAPILFMVALLAVLASAIAAGGGAFNSDSSAVNVKAQATAILEYAEQVKMAVDRTLGHGCTNYQISFENHIVSGYTNPNAPSDKSCHVFDVNGGGIVWKKPPPNASLHPEGYFYTGNYNFTGTAPTGGNEQPNNDLVMFLVQINQSLCAEINRMLFSSSSIPGNPPGANFIEARKFGTTFYWVGLGGTGGRPFSGCRLWSKAIYDPGAVLINNQYIFYQVLISN